MHLTVMGLLDDHEKEQLDIRIVAHCRVSVLLCYMMPLLDKYQGLAANHDFTCGKAVSLIPFKINPCHGYTVDNDKGKPQ